MESFSVRFLGVAGSTASSRRERNIYGSNTSCVYVDVGGEGIIFDMGTGILQLDKYIKKEEKKHISILISHLHYDHIEGFPYFRRFFEDCYSFKIFSQKREKDFLYYLKEYMREPFFPITPNAFLAKLTYSSFIQGDSFFITPKIKVDTIALNHPNQAVGYKLSYDNKSMVYLLDNEHDDKFKEGLINFCSGCDLMIYDACFTRDEYLNKGYKGWGHSTYEDGVELARHARVENIVFTHHSNFRTDKDLKQLQEWAVKQFAKAIVAREGLLIKL